MNEKGEETQKAQNKSDRKSESKREGKEEVAGRTKTGVEDLPVIDSVEILF